MSNVINALNEFGAEHQYVEDKSVVGKTVNLAASGIYLPCGNPDTAVIKESYVVAEGSYDSGFTRVCSFEDFEYLGNSHGVVWWTDDEVFELVD